MLACMTDRRGPDRPTTDQPTTYRPTTTREPAARPSDAAILRAAAEHDFLITGRRLAELGVTRSQRRRLCGTNGLLVAITYRVFAVGRDAASLPAPVLLRASLLHTGPEAAAAAGTATSLWLGDEPSVPFSLTRPHGPGPAAGIEMASVNVSRSLRSADLTTHPLQGIRLTTPNRSLLDLAKRDIALGNVDRALQGLARQGLTDVRRLDNYLARPRLAHHPNRARLMAAVDRHRLRARAESVLEDMFLDLVRDAGIIRPRTQVWTAVDGHRYRVDVLFEHHGLIVELKGFGSHATREELSDDASREARLVSAGFRLITFTYDQVTRTPSEVVQLLRANLDATNRPGRVAA